MTPRSRYKILRNRPKTTDETINFFIDKVAEELQENGGKLVFMKSRRIGELDSLGEFGYENDKPIIKVSVHNSNAEWFEVLVHEYGHALQALEKSKQWIDFENNPEVWQAFSKGCDKHQRVKFIKIIIALELDCEYRALQMIKKFGLPINLGHYARAANLTLYKWSFLGKFGIWPHLTENEQLELTKHCQPTLNERSNYSRIPAILESKFLEKCKRFLLS